MSPSARWPWLLPLAMRLHQLRRHARWWVDRATGRVRWARNRQTELLPEVVRTHASPLLRSLTPAEMPLQHGKVKNLTLAARSIDGIVVRPGETLSFNRLVGNATRRRGFVDGMRIQGGQGVAGVGGGLCQLANVMHWLTLHSDLTVVERTEHDVDLFPDQDRQVPWGSGCTIVYNYLDLVIRNDTSYDFQFVTAIDGSYLRGELRASAVQPEWSVEARAERFTARDQEVYRSNELWRMRRGPGGPVEELIRHNEARTAYPVAPDRLTP